jgi:hypothetical protein
MVAGILQIHRDLAQQFRGRISGHETALEEVIRATLCETWSSAFQPGVPLCISDPPHNASTTR